MWLLDLVCLPVLSVSSDTQGQQAEVTFGRARAICGQLGRGGRKKEGGEGGGGLSVSSVFVRVFHFESPTHVRNVRGPPARTAHALLDAPTLFLTRPGWVAPGSAWEGESAPSVPFPPSRSPLARWDYNLLVGKRRRRKAASHSHTSRGKNSYKHKVSWKVFILWFFFSY